MGSNIEPVIHNILNIILTYYVRGLVLEHLNRTQQDGLYQMYPITQDEIDQLSAEDIKKLSKLDSKGILVGPGETIEDFKKRLSTALKTFTDIENDLRTNGEFELYKGMVIKNDLRIPAKLLDKEARITRDKYKFAINWVPGFFLSKSLGLLWGGCSLTFPEEQYSVFLVRKNFKNREKWLIYGRSELLSHEICHVARAPINDNPFEEHFAYAVSSSALRRQIGNCFQSQIDALLFICPVFTLLAVQFYQIITQTPFSLVPFWAFAASGPAYLLLKNYYLRFKFNKAQKKLLEAGYKDAEAILFRCTKGDIFEIAKEPETQELIKKKIETDLRWQVIGYRFAK